jgi:hypothetical protein
MLQLLLPHTRDSQWAERKQEAWVLRLKNALVTKIMRFLGLPVLAKEAPPTE